MRHRAGSEARWARNDSAWVREWVAVQVGENVLYPHEYWMRFATEIPQALVEKHLKRLETEDFSRKHFGGMVAVVAARADATLAARVFSSFRDQRRKIEAEPETAHPFEHEVMRQLDVVFREFLTTYGSAVSFSPSLQAIPSTSVSQPTSSAGPRSDTKPLQLSDDDLKSRLRAYFKGSIDAVLGQDDFNGEQKASRLMHRPSRSRRGHG